MGDETSADKSTKPCCKNKEENLILATKLPVHGNPYPSKDVIQDIKPSMLETKLTSFRTMIQPYVSPFASAYEKTNDIMSIGVAHTQSTMQRLAENQSSIVNAVIISGAGLIGLGLAGRKGIFKKLLVGSVFFGGAMVACYPTDAEEKAQLLWYIAKNKLPVVVKQQYDKFVKIGTKETSQQHDTEPKVPEKP